MKPFWSGNLVLGQVSIPVGLVPAVRDGTPRLARLHRECMTPVGSRVWCDHDDRAVADEDIARGYEVAPGQHVLIQDEEIAAVVPQDTRTIEIRGAISAERIPRALVAASYLLAPGQVPVGRRPYVLVREALADSAGVVLLARLTVRGHEWLAQIRAERWLLVLDKLHPVEDLVDTTPLDELLTAVTVTEQEQQLANEVVRSRFLAKVPAGALQIEQRERMRHLVDAKIAGEPVQIAARPGSQTPPLTLPTGDLTDTLRKSIGRRRGSNTKTKPRARPAPVKR